jgi:hypothetical protein
MFTPAITGSRTLARNDDDNMVSSSSSTTTTVIDDHQPRPNVPPINHISWIRGVNLGGWLVLERYIVPYQFAITNCHVRGDLCWYAGQLGAPPHHDSSYRLCDLYQFPPLLKVPIMGGVPDYPLEEYTLGEAFLLANRGW